MSDHCCDSVSHWVMLVKTCLATVTGVGLSFKNFHALLCTFPWAVTAFVHWTILGHFLTDIFLTPTTGYRRILHTYYTCRRILHTVLYKLCRLEFDFLFYILLCSLYSPTIPYTYQVPPTLRGTSILYKDFCVLSSIKFFHSYPPLNPPHQHW